MNGRSDSPFEKWVESEGVPIIRGYHLPNAYEVPLKPWKRKGGLGAFVILEGGEGFSSAHICEIPSGASLTPQKHLFEERIYVLQGRGESKFWNEGGPVQTIVWQEYSLFSPPLNVWHQHVNTGNQPAKYVAVANAPLVFNMYRNPDFVFDTSFAFRDRYNSEPGYFDGVGTLVDRRTWQGGFIPDVRKVSLPTTAGTGKGIGVLAMRLSGNSTGAHLAQIEVGTYKKVHRHWAGAHLIIVQGTGCALMWQDWNKKVKLDFQKGTIYSPPEGWWHTHGNLGTEVVTQVALRVEVQGTGMSYQQGLSVKKGGDMMERDDEDPAIRRFFDEEMAKRGLKCTVSH